MNLPEPWTCRDTFKRMLRNFIAERSRRGASPDDIRMEVLEETVSGFLEAEGKPVVPTDSATWPDPPDARAFHGLAGAFAQLCEPHTEADPVALLVQFLAAFGNLIGRGAYFLVEEDRHNANLYLLLIGRTARGRKGTSWRRVQQFFHTIDPDWAAKCVSPGGLSSGEGLIASVRDPGPDEDASAPRDKRLLVLEGEIAGVLKVLGREGNTLSPTIRSLWDTGNAAIKTRADPLRASGVHLTIVAHGTREEFLSRLDSDEVDGGFVNRFLLPAVKRSKRLPLGGRLPLAELERLAGLVRERVGFGRFERRIDFDEDASALWERAYDVLGREVPGRFGTATARAEAQTVRLALLYAVLDGSDAIRREHLIAALALWDYCERSAFHVFGAQQADRVAEEVLTLLRSEDKWHSRSEIVDHLGRHASGHKLQQRLDRLLADGLIDERKEQETGGRPKQLFRAIKARKPRLLDLLSLSSQEPPPSEGTDHAQPADEHDFGAGEQVDESSTPF